MKIDTTNWKEFRVDKLFDVETSLSFDMVNIDISNTMDDEYKYEFIIRSKDNYGVKGYVKHLGIGPNKKNKITISQVGTIVAQYRDSDYYTSQNVFNLEPKFNLTENKALFFVNIFNCMLRKYIGYSDYPTKESLKKEVISLPAIDPDTPDFDYMEKYIEKMKFKYIDELEKDNDLNIDKALEVTGLSYEDLDKDLIVEAADKYEEFRVGDLFKVESSNKIYHANQVIIEDEQVNDTHPYVVRTENNRGVRGYINEPEENLNDGMTLSFAQDTFISFFQPFAYFTGNKVKVLKPKYDMSINVFLYLETAINKAVKAFTWGASSTEDSIRDTKILLPAIDKETPDFDYMEKVIYIYILQKRLSLKNYLMKKK